MRTAGSYEPNKTNERPGTRAQARYVRMSATKVRAVLDLVRGQPVHRAGEILQYTERDAAEVVGKCLASAVANAINNDGQIGDELFVAACYADEGPTLKRWRPRARGRATRIRKRTCHVTVVVSRLPEDRLEVLRARESRQAQTRPARGGRGAVEARRRRVARSRAVDDDAAPTPVTETEPAEAIDETPATATADVTVETTAAPSSEPAASADEFESGSAAGEEAEHGIEAAEEAPGESAEGKEA
jgi:large subunit ribosomal protein L22